MEVKLTDVILAGEFETMDEAEEFFRNKLNIPDAEFLPEADNEALYSPYRVDEDGNFVGEGEIGFDTEYGWVGYQLQEGYYSNLKPVFRLHTEIYPKRAE